ncbi:hypothetical protein AMS68_007093 [Peltaster fructicola]|uniref:DAGKc domain-containing protein n=1 Tax=Peltaster fructicola TaxID=286661 RepID=A0A6H0Y3P7_9PEZI|nr:hypothetical protein AMS68_007093 [Peltaster fructicola]
MSALTTPVSGGSTSINNPFDDPDAMTKSLPRRSSQEQGPINPALILNVDRNASLTIAAESLVVLDEGLRHRRDTRNCFGLISRWTKATQAIPFRNVLWAEVEDLTVTIKYARPVGRGGKSCRVGCVQYSLVEKTTHAHASQWVSTLMDRAYPARIKRRKRIKVLVNPFGGQGYAQSIWAKEVQPILAAAQCDINVEATKYRGHAIEIAEALDTSAFDVIAAASGDGLPHEIFNGLAKQKRPRAALTNLAVTQIPCGSGNALSWNTLGTSTPSWAAVEIVKGLSAPMDLMAVTQGKQRFYSFLSQAVGIIAESDLGTESLRWMGPLRFQWGVLVRIFGKTIYPAEISVAIETSDKERIRQMQKEGKVTEREAWRQRMNPQSLKDDEALLPPLRYGTVQDVMPEAFKTLDHPDLGNFYTGNMPTMTAGVTFFPEALLQDGFADLIIVSGMIPRTTALRMLTAVENGSHVDFPEVEYSKVHAYRISPRMAPKAQVGQQGFRWKVTQWLGGAGRQTEGLIAIDGEKVPFEPFQVEVHQGLGTVLVRSDRLFAAGSSVA